MVFAMTIEEPEDRPNVITGIMSIFQNDACVLIDSGSDKSYISSAFARLAIGLCPLLSIHWLSRLL